jgi:uncharacterized protein
MAPPRLCAAETRYRVWSHLCGAAKVLALIVAAATPANAQSFNCALAKYPDEVLIYQDSGLGRLDERLANLYAAQHNRLSGAERQDLERQQGIWLNGRRSCGRDRACIEQAYESRIDALTNTAQTVETQRKLTTLVTADGNCLKLLLAPDIDLSKTCNPKVLNSVYSDGRTSFTFMADAVGKQDQNFLAIITFSGTGNVSTGTDSAAQVVDAVIVGLDERGKPTAPRQNIDAVGNCQFSNPFNGQPAKVECEAKTKEGEFIAKFLTDGSQPDAKHF